MHILPLSFPSVCWGHTFSSAPLASTFRGRTRVVTRPYSTQHAPSLCCHWAHPSISIRGWRHGIKNLPELLGHIVFCLPNSGWRDRNQVRARRRCMSNIMLNYQYFFSATCSGLVEFRTLAFPCCLISDAMQMPSKFLPLPALAPMLQVFSVRVGTSALVWWQRWDFFPACHGLACTRHGLYVPPTDRVGELVH